MTDTDVIKIFLKVYFFTIIPGMLCFALGYYLGGR